MIHPEDYNYELPPELVALEPMVPRDHSQLFVYDTSTDTVKIDIFLNLSQYLPKDSFLVLNNTKVLPSRITLFKESGGRVKTLFLVNEMQGDTVKAMVDRNLELGQLITLGDKYSFRAVAQDEHVFTFKLEFPKEEFIPLLEQKGTMPIPPYLKKSKLTEQELKVKYQTIFAKDSGSAAAPTASLHFSEAVFRDLEQNNIEKTYVKLHVGAGTFAPLMEKNIVEKKLHKEWYEVNQATADQINAWKQEGRKLVSVGTTVTRTMESASIGNKLTAKQDETDIFIFPPYTFKMVDCLLTNFHVPKSSLMMLVEAFLESKKANRKLVELYKIAIAEKLRFFSFGDAMLIL